MGREAGGAWFRDRGERTIRIAILGSRGIPGNYGGFETCAEELSTRLVARGHEVIVYCCKPYSRLAASRYRGVRRIVLPTLRAKSLEKVVYSVLSLVHVAFIRSEVVLMLGVAAAPFCFLPRLTGAGVVLNTDGLEWRRRKWGRVASGYLRLAERAACLTADRLVTDARCVQDYYRRAHHQESTFIPYGARVPPATSNGTLTSLGLEPEEYVLYVSRFEPENNALLVRRAFEAVRTPRPIVMVGSAPYADEYMRQVRDTEDRRVRFPGAIYGDGYLELQSASRVYIQASEVGGTHPALVEAIGMGRCIIANDVPEHREVLGDAGLFYDGSQAGLTHALQEVLDHPELVAEYQARARRLAPLFSWDAVARAYETLFTETVSRRAPGGDPC